MEKEGFVYILASKRNGTLYLGVTSNLPLRVKIHREQVVEGFTNKYHVHRLVYYEVHSDLRSALEREKRMKKWKREWKIRLIEQTNPNWIDLYPQLLQEIEKRFYNQSSVDEESSSNPVHKTATGSFPPQG